MRSRLAVAAVCLLLAACGRGADEARDPTVTWGGSEGHPACVYDAARDVVDVTLTIDGTGARGRQVTVTVTAYADENTSQAVGSTTRSAEVDGSADQELLLGIDVRKPPHVDEDGVAACSLAVGTVRA